MADYFTQIIIFAQIKLLHIFWIVIANMKNLLNGGLSKVNCFFLIKTLISIFSHTIKIFLK